MRLTQIQQILEIERCTSISQAARNLYISQPALSALLTEFETEIGVQLFTRTKSGVKPTENGIYVLDSMKKIMFEVEYIQNFSTAPEKLAGNFTMLIGCSYEFLYADLIQKFKFLFPKANLIVDNSYSPNIADKISKGLLDMAIISFIDQYAPSLSILDFNSNNNLTLLPLKNCQTYAVMNHEHQKSKQKIIQLSELISEQLILGRQYDVNIFRKGLAIEKYPIIDVDRMTVHQLLEKNAAIYLDATPLSLEKYRTFYYPDYTILPVINDCLDKIPSIILEWPIHFIHRNHKNSQLQQLFIEETKHILQKNDLFK